MNAKTQRKSKKEIKNAKRRAHKTQQNFSNIKNFIRSTTRTLFAFCRRRRR